MKLIFSAGSLYTLPAETVFEMARDVGFDGMEVIINHDFGWRDNLAYLTSLSEILPINSLHAPFFEIDGWGNKIDQLKKCADLALRAEIPLINFHPPSWMLFEFKFWSWLKKINDFQEEIGQNRVVITIENMPCLPRPKINPYLLSKTEKLIAFMEDRNLFLTFDTAHSGSFRSDFLEDFHIFYDSGLMRNIHFSDYTNGVEHLMPGHGGLPLTRFLNHLRETRYDHSLVLELSPREFPEEQELIKETLHEVFDYLCSETKRFKCVRGTSPLGQQSEAAEPAGGEDGQRTI
ncbi:MAG TPA: sugar phosphate isomerase/epimerase family protein [Desulfuromonadales bacterium]|nr:sugar phosphate isomerase/epimerase family protein [Desulfuromonadales bacterium]